MYMEEYKKKISLYKAKTFGTIQFDFVLIILHRLLLDLYLTNTTL